jgi:transcriptional regulator with XRE-family HTH domain
MIIGDRLRNLREERNLTQGEIEKRTGLLRCYISRVENGHTVPSVETLEKFARALEVPIYLLFYEGPLPESLAGKHKRWGPAEVVWGDSGKDAELLEDFRKVLSRTRDRDRHLLVYIARRMAAM